MEKYFMVTYESPASTEFQVGIFKAKTKAKKCFFNEWNKIISSNQNLNGIDIIKDDETDKEYFYFDGSHGFTVKLQERNFNEMNDII